MFIYCRSMYLPRSSSLFLSLSLPLSCVHVDAADRDLICSHLFLKVEERLLDRAFLPPPPVIALFVPVPTSGAAGVCRVAEGSRRCGDGAATDQGPSERARRRSGQRGVRSTRVVHCVGVVFGACLCCLWLPCSRKICWSNGSSSEHDMNFSSLRGETLFRGHRLQNMCQTLKPRFVQFAGKVV